MKLPVDRFLSLAFVKNEINEISVTKPQRKGLQEYFTLYGYRNSQNRYRRLLSFLIIGTENFIDRERELLKYPRMSIQYFEILYGKDAAKEKWDKFVASTRTGRPNCIEYWISKGHSADEAIEKVKQHQTAMSSRSKNRDHKKYSNRCIEYWINKGFSEQEARVLISKQQTRDLDFFIKKYGEVDGKNHYNAARKKKKNTWKNKSISEKNQHRIKTAPKTYNPNGQEIRSIKLFIEQNSIPIENCMFGSPYNQFTQEIPGLGIRRYDLAVFTDNTKSKLIAIMEFHGPGHINFSDYTESMSDQYITIKGRRLDHLGTYGDSYRNDMAKRKWILYRFPDCKYYVFWPKDLSNKDFKVYDL